MFLSEIMRKGRLTCYHKPLIVQMIYKLLVQSLQIFKLVISSSKQFKVLRKSHQTEQVCRKNKLLHFISEKFVESFVHINDFSLCNCNPRYLLIQLNSRLHHSVFQVNYKWLEIRVYRGNMVMERVNLLLKCMPHLCVLDQFVCNQI